MDYCTWFPEGWWSHCCKAHDAAYSDQLGKLIADAKLFLCVASSGDSVTTGVISVAVAATMFIGVLMAGGSFYRNSKKKD